MLVLGVETSCDETSVAIVRDGKEVLSNVIYTQIDIHKLYGGVVPEVASRHHLKKITIVFDEALKQANVKPEDIDLVAVTSHPGLIGSLLVGINAAKIFALAYEKKYVEVDHIVGHIYANYIESDFDFPMITLVVSGGHTELRLMKDHYDFTLLGETLDDAVGESYDKVGRVMNLEYPAGAKVDKLAHIGKPTYKLPYVAYNQGSICHLECSAAMSFDFSSMNIINVVQALSKKSMMMVRKEAMEQMGAAYMANGIVTLAGSRLYTSMADTDEVIDEALNRFEDVFKLIKERDIPLNIPII